MSFISEHLRSRINASDWDINDNIPKLMKSHNLHQHQHGPHGQTASDMRQAGLTPLGGASGRQSMSVAAAAAAAAAVAMAAGSNDPIDLRDGGPSTPPSASLPSSSSSSSVSQQSPAGPSGPTSAPPTMSQGAHGNPHRNNEVRQVMLYGIPIVALVMDGEERLCLAQISNTLLKDFSYNEIHNRRVALGITCVQCTPVQLELLRRAGAMPVSSRRCGMITKREAERLCKSFLQETAPPKLPDNFAFDVYHHCAWGCRGSFVPSRYNSSRAKCIKCIYCGLFFSPNKFIFHSHRLPDSKYVQPDAANFNSWRRHIKLYGTPPDDVMYAWEDVKAMFNGGSRKRAMSASISSPSRSHGGGRSGLHPRGGSGNAGGGAERSSGGAISNPKRARISAAQTASSRVSPPESSMSRSPSIGTNVSDSLSPKSSLTPSLMSPTTMNSSGGSITPGYLPSLMSPVLQPHHNSASNHIPDHKRPSFPTTSRNPTVGHTPASPISVASLIGNSLNSVNPYSREAMAAAAAAAASISAPKALPTMPLTQPLPNPEDFRTSFAELMWSGKAAAAAQHPGFQLPYGCFLWPPRGTPGLNPADFTTNGFNAAAAAAAAANRHKDGTGFHSPLPPSAVASEAFSAAMAFMSHAIDHRRAPIHPGVWPPAATLASDPPAAAPPLLPHNESLLRRSPPSGLKHVGGAGGSAPIVNHRSASPASSYRNSAFKPVMGKLNHDASRKGSMDGLDPLTSTASTGVQHPTRGGADLPYYSGTAMSPPPSPKYPQNIVTSSSSPRKSSISSSINGDEEPEVDVIGEDDEEDVDGDHREASIQGGQIHSHPGYSVHNLVHHQNHISSLHNHHQRTAGHEGQHHNHNGGLHHGIEHRDRPGSGTSMLSLNRRTSSSSSTLSILNDQGGTPQGPFTAPISTHPLSSTEKTSIALTPPSSSQEQISGNLASSQRGGTGTPTPPPLSSSATSHDRTSSPINHSLNSSSPPSSASSSLLAHNSAGGKMTAV